MKFQPVHGPQSLENVSYRANLPNQNPYHSVTTPPAKKCVFSAGRTCNIQRRTAHKVKRSYGGKIRRKNTPAMYSALNKVRAVSALSNVSAMKTTPKVKTGIS
jgi:hypothetical protein